jgi:hypothetical protein
MLQHERLKFKLDTAEEHFRWRYLRAFLAPATQWVMIPWLL